MSSRPRLAPAIVLTGDMSSASPIHSAVTVLQNLSMISYSVSWTGSSPNGSITVEVSNDYAQDPTGKVSNAGTWSALTFMSNGSTVNAISVSGNTGNGFIDIDKCAAFAIRLTYTKISGTGTLTVVANGKVA